MRTYKIIILLFMAFALAACGAGIQAGGVGTSGTGSGTGAGDGGSTGPALEIWQVDGTRATIAWNEPEGGADTYESDNADDDFVDITPNVECEAGVCEYVVPGLDPNNEYEVAVIYDNSPEGTASVRTDLQEAYADGHAGETLYGASFDVGDANGDGNPDIIVGSRLGALGGARRVDLFLGGPENFGPGTTVMTPWAWYTAAGATHGFPVRIADVTCDGVGDVIIGQPLNVLDNNSEIYIYDGATLTAGAHASLTDHDIRLWDDDAATYFGSVIAPADMAGDGCDSMIVGAPDGHGTAGEVFLIEKEGGLDVDTEIDNSARIFAGAAIGDAAGNMAVNMGDVDADGLEEVLYSIKYDDSALPHITYDVQFNDQGVQFTTLSEDFNGSLNTLLFGPLVDGDYYVSGGMPAGGFVNMSDDRSEVIPVFPWLPTNQVTSDTQDSFGIGVAVGDFYPRTAGIELLVGTQDRIYVYYDYDLGASFDVTPDEILQIPGIMLKLVDIDNNGYLDIVSADFTTNPVNTGQINVYY